MGHVNDREVMWRLLSTPATWAIVGLSGNMIRPSYAVGQYIRDTLGMQVIPVNPRAEKAHGEPGYARLADVPAPVDVVDCFVNKARVGQIVDEAIAERERLGVHAVWLQVGVIDEDAAARAKKAGLDVVMDTCPAIETPRLRPGSRWPQGDPV